MIVEKLCPYCGKTGTLEISNEKAYESWQNGTLIQRAFPELSAEEREFIITGLCPECQTKIFNFEEEDEEK